MLFCKPLKDKNRYKPNREIGNGFTFTEYEKASYINEADWKKVVSHDDLFLSIPFLQVLESCGNVKLNCRYIILYKTNQPCGVIYYQLTDFKAELFGELLADEIKQEQSKRMKLFQKYVQSRDSEEIFFRMLTCGNNLISGDYGFKRNNLISEADFFNLLFVITKTISSEDNLRGKISAVLYKDFYKPIEETEQFLSFKAKAFLVEPNMVLQIPDFINSMDDYINLFSKKYRNRVKSIFASGANLELADFSLREIDMYKKDIYSLYENVFMRAKFKLLKLPVDYFSSVKNIFGDKFIIRGYFIHGKLAGFSSAFIHGDRLETHYIGINYELNQQHEIYQNILLDFISVAISLGLKGINFGRTASEIKSTIGARPQDLICYIQPQNTLSKILVKPFIDYLTPKDWIPRNPFKELI